MIGRQSTQGFLIGVMPGAGATIASFLGYAVERNIAKGEEQDEFGKGSIKGLAAPETANNAACTWIVRAAADARCSRLRNHGDPVGCIDSTERRTVPALDDRRPEIFWAVIVSMYLGNLVLLILNLPLIPYIAKVLAVPRNYLIPFMSFCTEN